MLENLVNPWITEQISTLTTEELEIRRLEERLTPLTYVQQQQVLEALRPPHDENVLAFKFGIPLTRRLAKCLNPRLWLNDEVINFQMQLLQDYDKRLCANIQSRTQSHFFNIFFMTNIFRGGSYKHKNVRR
jgi:Ulp1 family protease